MSLKLPKVVHKPASILYPCAVASSLPFVWYSLWLLSPCKQMIIAHYLRGFMLPEHLLVSPGNNFSNMAPTTISTRLHPATVVLCTFTCGYRLYSHSRHPGTSPTKAEGGPKSLVRCSPAPPCFWWRDYCSDGDTEHPRRHGLPPAPIALLKWCPVVPFSQFQEKRCSLDEKKNIFF